MVRCSKIFACRYGALRVRDLVTSWQQQEGEVEEEGPSYGHGSLGNKFLLDSVVVEAAAADTEDGAAEVDTQ